MSRRNALASAARFAHKAQRLREQGQLDLADIFTRDAAIMARLALELPQ